jgi:putative intracellular protease/amidase
LEQILTATKNILIVLTSHDKLGDTGLKTGFWLEEFSAPYYVFIDAGVKITLASPAGGQPPISPDSELPDFQTETTKRLTQDKTALNLLANTKKLSEVNANDYDAVFYPGGHGPLWDLTENKTSIALIENFITANKPVSAVCHATAAFLNVKTTTGEYIVKDKITTGFSNSEEDAAQLTDIVPFLLEDELIKRGAKYQKGDDWTPFALEDGLLVTGQNPASSALVAEKLLEKLKS